MYRQCPPRKTEAGERSPDDIEAADCMRGVAFEYVPGMHQRPGGPTAALLQIADGGVYMVLASVEGAQTTMHAFVYDSGHTDPRYPHVLGAIVDNRPTAPLRLLEPSDRASVANSRKAVDSFFGATTFVLQVYRMGVVVANKRQRVN